MNCIYSANFRIPPMETTGSTGAYGGLVETPETATLLAKKEPEVDDGVLSCDTPNERASRHSSPRRDLFPSKSQRAHCQPDENYCLLVTIQLQQSSDDTSAGVSVPAGALTDKIIRLYLSQVITDITQVVILSNTDFVVYHRR